MIPFETSNRITQAEDDGAQIVHELKTESSKVDKLDKLLQCDSH